MAAGMLAVAIGASPIDLRFMVDTGHDRKLRVQVGWLYGVLRKDVPSGRRPVKTPAKKKARSGVSPLQWNRIRSLLGVKGLWSAIQRLAIRAWRSMALPRVNIRLRIGLDDPADTGRMFAIAGPVLVFLASRPGVHLLAEPDFADETLSVCGEADLRIYPLRLLWAVALFILSPATLRAASCLCFSARRP
jgi:hypothetical protein